MRKWIICGVAIVTLATPSFAQLQPLGAPAKEPAWFTTAVESVKASFEPAEAKPGQTVTLKLTVRLRPGYHTYPLKQPDKAASGMVNKIAFPEPGTVVFVGEATDPPGYQSKAEPDLDIGELRYFTGTVTFERKAVVSPRATAGAIAVQLPSFKLSVCDKDNCFPPRALTPEATLTVLPGPAVPVESRFADEVK